MILKLQLLLALVQAAAALGADHYENALLEFAAEPTADADSAGGGGGGEPVRCEPIAGGSFCSRVNNYNSTRMPNFFQDTNQYEALVRAYALQELASSKCSAYIQNYLCELLAPICLEDPPNMHKFEIYPCRSVCRQVVLDCQHEVLAFAGRMRAGPNTPPQPDGQMPAGFVCEQLPYEVNGADGPCHELREFQPRARPPPPDTPTPRPGPAPRPAGPAASASLGASTLAVLSRYPNVLTAASVLLVLVLVLVALVGARRVGWCARSSASSSSASSRRVLSPGRKEHQVSVSPSSSSRSLMLLASAANFYKPQPQLKHTLLPAGQNPNQYQPQPHQPQHQHQQHQYDYIQVQEPQSRALKANSAAQYPAAEQQLYSNILLSSPNHQVLLMGATSSLQHPRGQQRHSPSYLSPYAAKRRWPELAARDEQPQ